MATGHSPFWLRVEDAIDGIGQFDRERHAFVNTRLDDARAEAAARAREAPRSPLHGVPFSLKDEWEATVLPTTGGSWRHRDRQSPEDGPVYRAFRDAGAVLVGKTNLSDMGIPPEATSYVGGATANPFDPLHTAGGSSGGAAAAVAWGMSAFDWGTDIGGSIRLPAAFCGVLGLRLSSETWPMEPTFPNVPDAMSWMCGQGPLAQTTDQIRAVLDVAAPAVRVGPERPFELRGAVLWQPRKGLWQSFADEVEPHLRSALDGPVHRDAELPTAERMGRVFAGMWASHFSDLLDAEPTLTLASGVRAVLAAVFLRGAFGDRRIHPSTAELLLAVLVGRATLYRRKDQARAAAMAVRDAYRALWDRGLVVVAPVCMYPPPRIGRSNRNTRVLQCTIPGNLTDATGLSVPFGRYGALPRSLQLMGPPGSERVLLSLADRLIASRDADPDQIPLRPPGFRATEPASG